jgi:murein DD-endopeptidase MepM/ murein hydrolase activator NlpD
MSIHHRPAWSNSVDGSSATAGWSPGPKMLGYARVGSGFVLPLTGPASVVTPFRPPAQRWGRGHRGVDLAAAAGTQIRVSGAGVVVFAGKLAGRNVVSVRHSESLRTTYEPVRPLVRVGEQVSVGQPIGVLETGHETCWPGTCLHWGARIGADHYLDPMSLLTGWRVRLRPWDGATDR